MFLFGKDCLLCDDTIVFFFFMQFFNWMQNKFNGGQGDKRPNAVPATSKWFSMFVIVAIILLAFHGFLSKQTCSTELFKIQFSSLV